MRRIELLVLVSVVAACGGGGGKGNGGTPAGGGGGGGGPQPGATLTVTGSLPLSAANSTVLIGSTTCSVGEITFQTAYAGMIASDQSGICGYLQRNQEKANARSVFVAFSRTDPSGGAVNIDARTYPVLENPTAETAFAYLAVSQADASCTSTDVVATSGTVTITSAGSDRLQGTIDATLSDGGKVTGAFDAAACAADPGDVCSGQLGPADPSCAN